MPENWSRVASRNEASDDRSPNTNTKKKAPRARGKRVQTHNSCSTCQTPFCSSKCPLTVAHHPCCYVPNERKEKEKSADECREQFTKLSVSNNGKQSAVKANRLPLSELPPPNESMISAFAHAVRSLELRESLEPVLTAPFKKVPFRPNAHPSKVYITDTEKLESGIIGCMPPGAKANFGNILNYFENFSDDTPYMPIKDEYVVVNYATRWFRCKVSAVLEEPNKTNVSVYFVDLGSERVVDIETVRRFPDDLRLNCYTELCVMHLRPGEDCPSFYADKTLKVARISREYGVTVLLI